MKPEPIQLSETISVPRTDPIYNCHAYLTKVPIGAIQPFIQTFTKPGEVVVDFFAGSGMTGLAALTLNRRARLSDISVLGKHIATGYLTDAPAQDIRAAAHSVMAAARKAVGLLYMTKRGSDGAKVEMIRTIWSFTYLCPSCGDEMVFYEALNARGGVPQRCPSCGGPFAKRNWPRGKDVPVEVVVQGENGRQVGQGVCETDRRRMRAALKDGRLRKVPSLPIEEDREMFSRSGLGRSGMTETKFFSGTGSPWWSCGARSMTLKTKPAGVAFRLHSHPAARLDALSVEREAASECAEPDILHRAGVFRVERL